MPRAKVYVHRRGLKHLVDPTKLVASAREALGPEEADVFGTMRAIHADRLVPGYDRELLDLGKYTLIFFHSHDHSPHGPTLPVTRNRCTYIYDCACDQFHQTQI